MVTRTPLKRNMPNSKQYEQDAADIIRGLRRGLDYSRIGPTAIALLGLIQDTCNSKRWHQSDDCSSLLQRLTTDSGNDRVAEVDKAYTQGISQMYRGAVSLCKQDLKTARELFIDAQRLFRDGEAVHSEGIALLAQGIVLHRQNERFGTRTGRRDWAPTLKALEHSLMIFRNLEDSLQSEVRNRLAEVQSLVQQDLKGSNLPTALKATITSKDRAKGKPVPVVARIAAGEAILAEENIERYLFVDAEIADQVTFGLTVAGHSMEKAAILDGDVVLIEQRIEKPPRRGQIVAAIVTQMDPEATLKKFYDEGDHILLSPANDAFPLIIVLSDPEQEADIEDRYHRSHPGRDLIFYSGIEPTIAGWARTLIREEIV